MTSRHVQILQIVVFVVTLATGIVLRFQPMPERVLGGGLIAIAIFLPAVWRARKPKPTD